MSTGNGVFEASVETHIPLNSFASLNAENLVIAVFSPLLLEAPLRPHATSFPSSRQDKGASGFGIFRRIRAGRSNQAWRSPL